MARVAGSNPVFRSIFDEAEHASVFFAWQRAWSRRSRTAGGTGAPYEGLARVSAVV